MSFLLQYRFLCQDLSVFYLIKVVIMRQETLIKSQAYYRAISLWVLVTGWEIK